MVDLGQELDTQAGQIPLLYNEALIAGNSREDPKPAAGGSTAAGAAKPTNPRIGCPHRQG